MHWGEAAALNRAHWDALARVHGEGHDSYYDVEALAGGADSLLGAEAAAVGDVSGLDVLHVQCHLGFDAVSLTRRGARVTGVDFSAEALAKARVIAERCGVSVEYVQADVLDLPAALRDRFDLAYASIGVICWIDDVGAWMRSVARTLRPAGRLVLVELHPVYDMVGSLDPLVLDFPYSGAGGGRRFDEDGSYAAPEARLEATESMQYAHSLGEVVTAALDAGLRVDALREHLDVERDPRGTMLPPDPDGRCRLRVDGELLPVLFTLVASRA